MTKKKILVVDDEESMLVLIDNLLSSQGFEVFTTDDAEEGFRILEEQKPDLAIIDIMMPDMNGIELAERVRKTPEIKDTKIMFITVVKSEEVNPGRLKKVKPLDYIGKPFENEVLVAKVKKFTE